MSNIIEYSFNPSINTVMYTIDMLLKDGVIDCDTTIISYGTGSNVVELARYLSLKNIKGLIVIPDDLYELESVLYSQSVDVIKAPGVLGYKNMKLFCEDMKLEIENSYVLDFMENKYSKSAHFKLSGKEIVDNYNFSTIVIPVGTGASISGLSKYIKMKSEASVIGVSVSNRYNIKLDLDMDLIDDVVQYSGVSINEALRIEASKHDNDVLILIR